jgi:hypothetical protein
MFSFRASVGLGPNSEDLRVFGKGTVGLVAADGRLSLRESTLGEHSFAERKATILAARAFTGMDAGGLRI